MNIEKIVRLIAVSAIFAVAITPLIVVDGLFFPFVTGKAFLFRTLVEIAFFSWVLLVIFGSIPRPKITPIRLTIGIFVTIVALADFAGVAPVKSFWSNFERMEGLVTIIYLLGYFVVAGSVLQTQKHWQKFWNFSLLISALIGFMAMGDLIQKGFDIRVATTLGNPIYLAVYMLFHMFIAGLLMVRTSLLWQRMVYGVLIFLQGFILYNTGTRGTLLALLGGVFVTGISILLLTNKTEYIKVRKAAFAGIIMVGILVGGFFLIRDTHFVQNSPVLNRFARISLTEGTSMARLTVWNIAWQGVKERPLLGWGQENFTYVFNKYYDPKMYAQELWFDRTHNVMMDWLIAAGLFGLLAYLSMYFAVIYEAWRSSKFDNLETSIIIGLLAAYGIHNLFVFDHLISYIMFFSLAAWLHALDIESSGFKKKLPWCIHSQPKRLLALLFAVVFAFGCIYIVNTNAYTQNKVLIQALGAAARPETVDDALPLFRQALAYNAYGTQEVREQLARAASRITQSKQVNKGTKQEIVKLALGALKQQQQEFPNDARAYVFAGSLLMSTHKYSEALREFERAHEISPEKQAILYQLGLNALSRKKYQEAVGYFKTAYELEIGNIRALLLYAVAQIHAGNTKEADELLQIISEDGVVDSPTLLNVYVQKKMYTHALKIWQLRVKKHPNNADAHFALASTYVLVGDNKNAIQSAQYAAQLNPNLKQRVDEFIKGLE